MSLLCVSKLIAIAWIGQSMTPPTFETVYHSSMFVWYEHLG